MKKSIFAALVFVGVASAAFAQGRLFEDGQSGFTGSLVAVSEESVSEFGLAFDHSFSGGLDVGVSVLRASFDESEFGPDFSGYSISPSAGYYLIKPESGSGLGFALVAAYQYGGYSGDFYLDTNGFSVGGEFFFLTPSTSSVRFVPSVRVVHVSVDNEVSVPGQNPLSGSASDVGFSVTVDFVVNEKLLLAPGMVSIDGETSWALSIGLLAKNAKF